LILLSITNRVCFTQWLSIYYNKINLCIKGV